MIQDWGYNYLYLCHEGVITRVNLRNHAYRDVTHSPVEEFDSASSESTNQVFGKGKELWMCIPSCVDMKPKDVVHDRVMTDEAYVPVPFPKHQIEPQEWIHALATLDVCAIPKPTRFCDSDGYDITPIMMMDVLKQKEPSPKEFYDAENEMVLPIHMIKVNLDSLDEDHYEEQYLDYVEEECSEPKNVEKNIVQLPYVVLDTCFIEALPCIQGEIPLFTNKLGVIFKLIYTDPNSRVLRKPMLRMLQYYADQTIAYIDSCNNIYNPCTFNNAQEGSLTWFPCLTRNESRQGRHEIIATKSSSTQRNPELKSKGMTFTFSSR